MDIQVPNTLTEWNEVGADYLPGLVGLTFLKVEPTEVIGTLSAIKAVNSWNGFLHAGTVVTLADTCCGYGTARSLPANAAGFTTIELKSNFISTVRSGDVKCIAQPLHQGRTTQVWDAVVGAEGTAKVLAHFRCTQMILYAT